MQPDLSAKIMKGLETQKAGYAHLLELADQQKAAIIADDDARLRELVRNKEQRLQDLRRAEKGLLETVDTLSRAEREHMREQAAALQEEVVTLMEKLIEIETDCAERLKSKKLETRDELTDLKHRKQRIQGYGTFRQKGTGFSGDA
ncbi:flagellar export chaperone FlgN [Nitrospina gracilis]|uniref:flagellar export chaperone FlgN n=1 Tax=Nitrospina gracilis TaxID=35801 RepID=UPI001F361138|nr:flagellar export chaperone FlgN [Nitrospina gracilis]MCF8719768.1 Spy/CpxP family protein refolding chaperone [Nitrospina gracilis Nb-211]